MSRRAFDAALIVAFTFPAPLDAAKVKGVGVATERPFRAGSGRATAAAVP